MQNSEELTAKIDEARQREAKLTQDVSDVAARLQAMKAAYQTAVESGEPESKLDKRDEEIIRAERELVRSQIRLSQVKNDIAALESERAKAQADERQAEFLKHFDQLVEEKFIMAELALTEFKNRMEDIEQSVRSFMNEAARAGYDVHRLRISDHLRRGVTERLFPGYLTKSRPDYYAAPLANVLEDHVRTILGMQVNGTVSNEQTEGETIQ